MSQQRDARVWFAPAVASPTYAAGNVSPLTTFSWPQDVALPGYHPVTKPHAKQIREAARLLATARRPVRSSA